MVIAYLRRGAPGRDRRALVEDAGRRVVLVPTDPSRSRLPGAGRQDGSTSSAASTSSSTTRPTEMAQPGGIADITTEQLDRVMRTNVYAMFWLCRSLPHMKSGRRSSTPRRCSRPRLPGAARLRHHQGGDRELHARPRAVGRPAGHPRQRRRARADLGRCSSRPEPEAIGPQATDAPSLTSRHEVRRAARSRPPRRRRFIPTGHRLGDNPGTRSTRRPPPVVAGHSAGRLVDRVARVAVLARSGEVSPRTT